MKTRALLQRRTAIMATAKGSIFGWLCLVSWCRETDDEEEGATAEEGNNDGEGEKPLTRRQIIQGAVVYLTIGAAACAFFSDPMVDAVTNFSKVIPRRPTFQTVTVS
jgi:hypothetical protein